MDYQEILEWSRKLSQVRDELVLEMEKAMKNGIETEKERESLASLLKSYKEVNGKLEEI